MSSTFWTNLGTSLKASKAITLATKSHSEMSKTRITKDILNLVGEPVGIEEGTIKFFAAHLYMITGVDPTNQTIDLQNPHGTNHIKGLSKTQLEDYFENCQEC